MIIQPTPTGPASHRRRRLRVAAIVAPVALLWAVIVVGLAGPRPATAPDGGATTSTAVGGDGPSANPAGPSATAPSSPGAAQAPGPPPAFPTVAADLGVRSIADAQRWLSDITPGPVAVAGWLTGLHPLGACPAAGGDTRGVLGPMCPRRARLLDGPPGEDSGQEVYLTIPAGTRLPPPLERSGSLPDALAVVVVGRTGDLPHPCLGDPNECRSDLRVERVVWADGAPFDPGPVFDAYLEDTPAWIAMRNLDAAETLAIGWDGTILQAALVRPTSVAAIDADAARAMASAPRPVSLVWYVRGLETGYDPIHAPHGEAPPRYSWVVLDYETGATLARGPKR